MADLTLGEAAKAIGVSADTLRRWDRSGKLSTTRDARNRRLVPPEEVERLSGTPRRHKTGNALSARNRFAGIVKSVEVDGVMALVEIQAGPTSGRRRGHARRRGGARVGARRARHGGGQGDLRDGRAHKLLKLDRISRV